MRDWYNYSWSEVIKELNSSVKYGLSLDKVDKNRDEFGDNKTLNLKSKSFIILFLKNLIQIYSLSAIFTAILLFFNAKIIVACFILCISLTCVTIYSIKEYKNENRLDHLTKIAPSKALAIRDGKSIEINPDELVVGDIIYLEEGDIVPADARLIECYNLKVKESAITGDNKLVEKYETKIEDREILPSEMKNMVFKSSFVIEGTAKAIVVEVGDNTKIGSITKELLKSQNKTELLDRKVYKLINLLSIVFMVFSICVILYNFLEKANIEGSTKIISLIWLIIVPVQIMMIVIVISLIIHTKNKKHGIKLGDLSSIETLSSIDVLIANKVGSITEERLFVRKIYTNGSIIEARSDEDEDNKHNIDRIINIGLLCNDAHTNSDGKIIKGDFADRALVFYGKENSISKRDLEQSQERIFKIPFDYERKIKTTLNKVEDKYRANVIGAVDKLLVNCTHIMKNGIEVEITTQDIIDIKSQDLKLSKESLYVTGFAYRNFNYEPSINENIESNLVFVGLIGFENPCKENVQGYMDYCRSLAIKPIIVTEDNKITAQSLGNNLGILNKNDMVLSGVEIDNMDDDELEKFIEKVSMYSRISSKIKSRICEHFKKLGYKLAVTGSKFTDLPSFKASHIGIATGKNCTNIAKELGDIFIEDNDFKVTLDLIKNSRQLLKSIKNIIVFNLVIVTIEFLAVLCSSILNKNIDVKYSQIIFLNFITVTLSSLMIYSQFKNIEKSNYEKVDIDRTVFKSFSSGIKVYILFVVIASIGAATFNIAIGDNLWNISMFTVIDLSAIFFSFYFVDYKKVLKNKVSILLVLLTVISYLIFVQAFTGSIVDVLKNIFWNSKVIIGILIVEMPLISFIKELDDDKR
ncbi:cation transport ATPase [Clostridium botulinum C str. Eklund]|nr:cation transport ATPase [Clostridium botulinum C str. Eklund]NEZ49456.1 cation-transporting P-type ATPase [Clostridium botulinum]